MHTQRLLNVARALRESPNPHRFTMATYGGCGTPACALGHYAFRTDLQDVFAFTAKRDRFVIGDEVIVENGRVLVGDGLISCNGSRITEHFGITHQQATELFHQMGCGDARRATDAADYIEAFVARNEPRALIPANIRAIFTMTPAELAREFERT